MNNESNSDSLHKTFFDSPERSTQEEIQKEISLFENNPIVKQLLDGFPEIAFIINKNRQIITLNSKALKGFNSQNYQSIFGKRFGEAINCIHIHDNLPGCGTTKFCSECGVAKGIKISNNSQQTTEEECRLTVDSNGSNISYDLLVRTQQIEIFNSHYSMVAIRDISNEKRREALERIFFHDILNTAGAVNGLAELLHDVDNEEDKTEFTSVLKDTSRQLINEIIFQRELRSAEDGVLIPAFRKTTINETLNDVYDLYKNHELSKGKILSIEEQEEDVNFFTDSTLLIRSLGNLFKNSLEASEKNDLIRISASLDSPDILFNIYNEKVIPNRIQLQLFQRSFSTKQSKGRGIGLYSVKLIVEQYLKGKVSFVSNDSMKTIFTIRLPQYPK
ncbi:MAG: HAMP domain-containing sensor histidine kinase [Ignavibacteriales bacterium]|nr:HAMP domain-containing sensor histidine kinase [Ignavibacteriales bacterium]